MPPMPPVFPMPHNENAPLFRPFALTDLRSLVAALSAIWFSHDQEHPKSEKLFSLHYLTSCLAKADICLCLEAGGRACGAVICAAPASPPGKQPGPVVPGRLKLRQKLTFRALCAFFALCIRLNPYCREGNVYHQRYGENYELLEGRIRDRRHKGEVILLFADPAVQGRGLGKKLLQAGEEALTAAGVQRIYLLTDVNCTFGLYPRCGYTLSDQVRLDFSARRGAGEYVFDCFIYEKKVESADSPAA